MCELRVETWTMPSADLGKENPLPVLTVPKPPVFKFDDNLTAEDRRYMGWGRHGAVPFTMLDGYNRQRRPRGFKALVLENNFLKATFLPELGGRLWSLVDKTLNRELLYVNPVFQPANLAIRNAWFSGGVEWNASILGHHERTCCPMFAARAPGPGGLPMVRIYEWCRIRQVPFQIDFCLAPDRPVLLAHARIVNPHDEQIPTYWWSNIAVTQSPDVRVLAPATQVVAWEYALGLGRRPFPMQHGVDRSYPTNAPTAADQFFCLPAMRQPWIAAIDGRGQGLLHTSTSRLKGRKFFVWGMGRGGQRWQEFLSDGKGAYIELQAGLAQTQSEKVPMPAREQWEWTETYSAMSADPKAVHQTDFDAAAEHVNGLIQQQVPPEWLDAQDAAMHEFVDQPPTEHFQLGSGWAALERRRRQKMGQAVVTIAGMPFPDESMDAEQAPWLTLLELGHLPKPGVHEHPASYMIQPQWRELLEHSVQTPQGDHWFAHLHLGMMYWGVQDQDRAVQEWQRSIQMEPSAWAYRNLAFVQSHLGNLGQAADLWVQAFNLKHDLLPLAVETILGLLAAGRAAQALEAIEQLPPELARLGRVRLLLARTYLELDRPQDCIDTLKAIDEVTDLREGENSLSDLWARAHYPDRATLPPGMMDLMLRESVFQAHPLPHHLDFRMWTPPQAKKC